MYYCFILSWDDLIWKNRFLYRDEACYNSYDSVFFIIQLPSIMQSWWSRVHLFQKQFFYFSPVNIFMKNHVSCSFLNFYYDVEAHLRETDSYETFMEYNLGIDILTLFFFFLKGDILTLSEGVRVDFVKLYPVLYILSPSRKDMLVFYFHSSHKDIQNSLIFHWISIAKVHIMSSILWN